MSTSLDDDQRVFLYFCYRYTRIYLGLWKAWSEKIAWKQWKRRNGHPKRCFNCGREVRWNKKGHERNCDDTATLDHIIPRSYLESHNYYELYIDSDNFTLLCGGCNQYKKDKMPKTLPRMLALKLESARQRALNNP